MKKKVIVRILCIAIAVFMISTAFSNVFAKATVDIPIDSMVGSDSTGRTEVKSLGNTILGIVQVVAAAVAVIMLIVLAIKYISASPNDKASIKQSAIVYIVGAICLFGASGLLSIIQSVGEGIGSSTKGG